MPIVTLRSITMASMTHATAACVRPEGIHFRMESSGATATARLLWDQAPKTCAAIVSLLPIDTMCWHGRNSGAEALLITPTLVSHLPQVYAQHSALDQNSNVQIHYIDDCEKKQDHAPHRMHPKMQRPCTPWAMCSSGLKPPDLATVILCVETYMKTHLILLCVGRCMWVHCLVLGWSIAFVFIYHLR